MIANKVVAIVLGIALSSCVFAGEDEPWKPAVTLSLGSGWSNPGKTQTLYIQPELPETFAANSTTSSFGDGEFFLGLQHYLATHLQAQLGLAVAGTTAIHLNGDIWQDADPNFNNLSYAYKISHAHIAAKGKLLTDVFQLLQPYISGSFGVGFNHAYHYSNTPKLFEVLTEPTFNPKTTTAFTYTLGLGLQRALNNHWSVGVGYEFAEWGKAVLAEPTTELPNSRLVLNHIYTNQLQFSLSFVA